MNSINIEELLASCAALTETALSHFVPASDAKYGVIFDAMRYSLMAGGKRLRPFLTFEFACLAARESGGDPDEAMAAAIPFACALEMIHTYSLIHDDLPCMDNDDLRRGKPTNHKVYGEADALLAGDALLTRAFGTASMAGTDPSVTVKAIRLLSDCAGADGMIGGQILDLIGENEKYDVETLELMQSLKTGELIRCAALLGCLAGGASEALAAAAERYAMGIGRAFQIIDDVLDVCGDEALLGKPIGSDKESGKTTFVTHMSVEEAKNYAKLLTDDAKTAISDYEGSEVLCALADWLLSRNK